MSDDTVDFDAEELAALQQTFAAEAMDAFETVTRICVAAGGARPAAAEYSEMLRVTHGIKGAAGTVGMHALVDGAHRLEVALLQLRDGGPWLPHHRDRIIDVCDALRELVARPHAELPPAIVHSLEQITSETAPPVAAAVDAGSTPLQGFEPVRAHLRISPDRIDAVVSNASELLFDRTRIERRAQYLRTVARELTTTRQQLQSVVDGKLADVAAVERKLAEQTVQLAQASAALVDETEALRQTISELQKSLTALRMDSAQSLFAYSARALRALRRATGADVELQTRGENTEFDKTVAEALHDPIVQLLRNVVSHAVEAPAVRLASGKPAHVTVSMTASHEAGQLVLRIADDGPGINTAALRAKLVSTGHWTAAKSEVATDDDVLKALLRTPISVKASANAMAGHGIGLDAVRERIARLGGEVTVTSVAGRGTAFDLRVPISTALGTAMLFKVAGQTYALPAIFAVSQTVVEAGVPSVVHEQESIPVLSLERLLGGGTASGPRPALVVSFAGRAVVCTVDKIVGVREIVIKQLDPLLAPLNLFAGATISGSGKVQLIVDPSELMRLGHATNVAGASASKRDHQGLRAATRALVVDDSRAIREAMTSMLSREGWLVDVAEDGSQALAACKQHDYDVVFTDLEMPHSDGWALIANLRQRANCPALVVITSRAHSEHRARAQQLGVTAFVAKPVTRRKLTEALAALPPAPPAPPAAT